MAEATPTHSTDCFMDDTSAISANASSRDGAGHGMAQGMGWRRTWDGAGHGMAQVMGWRRSWDGAGHGMAQGASIEVEDEAPGTAQREVPAAADFPDAEHSRARRARHQPRLAS